MLRIIKNYKTKKKIFDILNSAKIPNANLVLPSESFANKRLLNTRRYSPSFAFSKIIVAVSLVGLVTVSAIIASNHFGNKPYSPSLPGNHGSSSTRVESDIKEKTIVTTDGNIELLSDEMVYNKTKIYISELLQKKTIEFNGKDVVFRVAVDLPLFDEAEQLDFAKKAGATNIISFSETTDFKPLYKEGYIMEVSYDTLNKMIEHKGYILRLAPPERTKGYSSSIADHLTITLDKMSEKDTLEVQVITRADMLAGIVGDDNKPLKSYENIYFETPYEHSPITLPWESNILSLDELEKYIDEIIERNDLNNSFVKKERLEYDPYYEVDIIDGAAVYDSPKREQIEDMNYIGSFFSVNCTFRIKLTKAEILRLSEDSQIAMLNSIEFLTAANHLPMDE